MVKDFLTSVLTSKEHQLSISDYFNDPLVQQCSILLEKLEGLVAKLKSEAAASTEGSSTKERTFQPRDTLMMRANSLKKALRGVIDMTEKGTHHSQTTTFTANFSILPNMYAIIFL